ncbi:MAG: ABC transporter ATP-binding protein [Thermoanaerobaculia bacterium]
MRLEPGAEGVGSSGRDRRGRARGGRDRFGHSHGSTGKLLTLLELLGISKSFGETRALAGASLTVLSGEIHALLGENGAGKSTLVAIAAGLLRPDGGTIRLAGRDVDLKSAREARRGGVALVPQHDLLVEAASVAENLALLDPSAPFVESPSARRRRVTRLAETFDLDLGDPDATVADLPVGTRQRIELAGALAGDPEILVLDEPTAVLAPHEASALFSSLKRRAAAGRAVVLITHRLAEVFEAADRLTLLARGKTVKSCRTTETTKEEIGSLLLGSAEKSEREEEGTTNDLLLSRGRCAAADSRKSVSSALEIKGLVPSGSSAPPASFSISPGETVVLLAIDGNGADVLASCIAGLRPFNGSVRIGREGVPSGGFLAFRALGGRYVPADRRAEGLVAPLSLAENLALPDPPGRFFLAHDAMRENAAGRIRSFGVRAASPEVAAETLSGGNQQKLVLARELDPRLESPRLLVAIHPTRGLDLAASADVHERIEMARSSGTAVLVVSADPDEARLFGGTFRVVYRGRLSEPLPEDTPLEALSRRMAGLAA